MSVKLTSDLCVCQIRAADGLSHRLYRRRRARRAAWKVSRRTPKRKQHILNREKSGISWPDIKCDLVHDLAARAGFVRDVSGLVVSFPK